MFMTHELIAIVIFESIFISHCTDIALNNAQFVFQMGLDR